MENTARAFSNGIRKDRGGILVIAVIVILAMLIVAIPFLVKLSGQYRVTEKSSRSISAFNLAEAGIDRAFWQMNLAALPAEHIEWTYAGGIGTASILGLTTSDGKVAGDIDLKIGPPAGTDPERQPLEGKGKVPYVAGRTVERSARVVLEEYFDSIWDFGFFVDERFHNQNGNFFMDSYDSGDGAYGGTNSQGTDVYFGTNSDGDQSWWIEKGGPSSEIYGTIAFYDTVDPAVDPPNPIDDPDTVIQVPKPEVFMSDEPKMTMQYPFDLPSVNPVNYPSDSGSGYDFKPWFTDAYKANAQSLDKYSSPPIPQVGDLNPGVYKGTLASGNTVLTPTEDSGIYSSFVISKGTVTVSGGDVGIMITGLADTNGVSTQGTFWINKGNLVIEPGSSLTLILGNTSFKLENNTNVNSSGNPPQLFILGMDQFTDNTTPYKNAMYLENNGVIKAGIYVPRADIISAQGKANIDLFGSAIAYSMDFKTNTNFHYDEALGEISNVHGGPPKWKIISWQEVL